MTEELKQEAQPRPFPLYKEVIFRRANRLPQLRVRQGKLRIGTKTRPVCAALDSLAGDGKQWKQLKDFIFISFGGTDQYSGVGWGWINDSPLRF